MTWPILAHVDGQKGTKNVCKMSNFGRYTQGVSRPFTNLPASSPLVSLASTAQMVGPTEGKYTIHPVHTIVHLSCFILRVPSELTFRPCCMFMRGMKQLHGLNDSRNPGDVGTSALKQGWIHVDPGEELAFCFTLVHPQQPAETTGQESQARLHWSLLGPLLSQEC